MSKQSPTLYLLTLALATIASVQAQNLATITGTISDGTGAILAGVPIEVRNLETGAISRAVTTNTGNYTVSQLPIGDYSLLIEASGFKQYVRANFHLALSQIMREDVSLEVGQSTESITVTANSSLLKTESSEVASNVTLAQLNTLPVLTLATSNAGFRDPYAAVKLMPGFRFAPGSYAESIVVNGAPVNTLQVRLDGMTQTPTSGRLAGANNQNQPSVDAIEEIAGQTSNFAAELGTSGGAMLTMTTKSGTNKFHGSVYDYAANEVLNAHQPYTGLRNRVRQTDWGFTFGGPVKIPKIYDGAKKTFFFWSFEQYREKKTISTGVTTVPTDAYRAGDFTNLLAQENRLVRTAAGNYVDPLGRTVASGAIFDPASQRPVGSVLVRDQFVGNQIPLSRFDPVSVKILTLVPHPYGVNAANGQAGSNYLAPYPLSRLSYIPSIKIDQNIGGKLRASFYFQRTFTTAPKSPTSADNFSDPITAGPGTRIAARTARATFDYSATPLLLMHVGLGYNDIDSENTAQVTNYDSYKELGLVGQTVVRNFPRIVTSSQSAALGGMTVLGFSLQQLFRERRPTGNVTATYVTGSHTVKLGVEGRQERYPDTDLSGTNGLFNFLPAQTQQTSLQGVTTNQGFTGFNLASFVLGDYSSATQRQPIHARTQKSQWAMFLQDTWKVTRKLTLDYGVRWDYGSYAAEQYGRYGSFDPGLANPSAAGRLGARAYESSCKCHFAQNYPFAIGPRLGFAYQIDRKTVIRGGVGVVYNATSTATGSSVNYASTATAAFGQAAGNLRTGIPSDVRAVWPTTDPGAGHPVGSVIAPPFFVDKNAGRPARLLQYSFSLQREINRDLVVEAAYVANRGVWWEANGLVALNALQVSDLSHYGFKDFTSASDSALLTATIANLTTAQRSTLASRGVTGLPYSNFPNSQSVRSSLTQFPQFSGSPVMQGAPLGNTWYDSLQVTVTKRYSHGLTLNLNYTASKTLELLSASDVYNRANGKAFNAFERPQVLRLTAQYTVPTLKNTGMALFSNNIVSYVLSGWGIGTYMQYQSGAKLSIPTSTSSTPISQFLGRGPGSAQRKLDANGSYMNPWSVDWTDYDGNHHTDPIDINCHCFDPTKTIVLNPLAWENIPNGQWGNQQTPFRDFQGPRLPDENANFNRNFLLKEGINFNVRVEFTNIFNRTRMPTPTSLTAFATNPTKFSSGAFRGLYSSGFGVINPTTGTADQRSGSFVARLTF